MAGTGISEAELLDKLRLIKAHRLLIVIDACYSGNISPSRTPQDETRNIRLINPPEESTIALLGTGSGRIIITSCRENQVSFIGTGTISIFTQALVDGLRGKGVHNNNGMISAFSLYEQLYAEVREVVETQISAIQEPVLTVLKGVGPFAVALYKGATYLGEFEPEQAPQSPAVREVSPEKSTRYFRQHIVNTGGGAYVSGNVQRNKIGGDNIRVGNISGSQGVAIGHNASVSVTSSRMSSVTKINLQELRAVLEELWDALDTAQLQREQKRITQTAASNALDSVEGEESQSTIVIENVKKIGDTIRQTNVIVEEGSDLWQSVLKLIHLVGPLVGGARTVAGWFGISL